MFSANICFCSRNLLQSWKRWPSPPRVQRLDTNAGLKIGRLQTNCFWTCDYAMDLGSLTFLRWTTGKRSGCLQKTRTAAFRSRRWGNASWQSGREHACTYLQKLLPYYRFNPRLVLHNLPGKRIPEAEVHRIRDAPLCQLCSFLNCSKRLWPPPLSLDIFLTYWEALPLL